jgi:AraC family transcriptional regulator
MPRENVKQPPAWLTRVLEKLAVEHSQRLTLDELSSEAAVHPVHLSRVFRKFVGEGIGEHVRRLRIRAACEQMLAPEISMAEISLATGFADQSHFTRAFRKVTGMTPAVFRVQVSGKTTGSRPQLTTRS